MIRLFKLLSTEIKSWLRFIICAWPDNYLGFKLRQFFWSKQTRSPHINISRHARIITPRLLSIGSHFVVGESVIIDPNNSKGIYIGNNVAIALRTYIRAANHRMNSLEIPINAQGHECATIPYQNHEYSIVIEDDVWVGANAIILSGSLIGKGSVIAAGAVVSSTIPPYSIVVGNPGRVMGNRQKKSSINLRETQHAE